jgi:ribosomal protein S18 acetylase RimI-like enzyme
MSARHGARVAELHRQSLPAGFLSRLGDRFLARLYRAIGTAPRSGVWVAEDAAGRCLGFVSGSCDVGRCYRSVLLRAGAPLLWLAAPALLRPAALKHAAETLTYPLRGPERRDPETVPADDEADAPPDRVGAIRAELLSIAVDGEARGLGLGRRLVQALETAFLGWGHAGPYRVVTDAEDPRSNAFYVGVGFTFVHRFRHHGHPMALFVKEPEGAGR